MVSFECVFDETIFEGMKGDNDCNAAWAEDFGEDSVEHGFDMLQFLIHGNSERLKNAGGCGATGVGAKRTGDFSDACREVSSSLNGAADSSAVGNGRG